MDRQFKELKRLWRKLSNKEEPRPKAKTGRGAWIRHHEHDDMRAAEIFGKLRPFLFVVKSSEYLISLRESAQKQRVTITEDPNNDETTERIHFPLQFACRLKPNQPDTFSIVWSTSRNIYASGIWQRKPTFDEFTDAYRAAMPMKYHPAG